MRKPLLILLAGVGLVGLLQLLSGRAPAAALRPGPLPVSATTGAAGRPAFGGVPAQSGPAAPAMAAGTRVVFGKWGSQPGEFGRRADQEANPEGPMALAAGAGGELALVDQLNRRIQRFSNGKLTGTIAIGGDTVQDLALAPGGKTVLLDRLADKNVQIYDSSGKLINEIALAGRGIGDAGDVTGVFADAEGVYVEREHTSVVRVALPSGDADPDRPELLGRPSRDGRSVLQAEILRRSGRVMIRATDRVTNALRWARPVELGAPILHVLMLDSDRHGRTYLAATVGRESPTGQIVDEHLVVIRLGADGTPAGLLRLPPLTAADESFRPVTVDDDGAILVMQGQEGGLGVMRYTFPG